MFAWFNIVCLSVRSDLCVPHVRALSVSSHTPTPTPRDVLNSGCDEAYFGKVKQGPFANAPVHPFDIIVLVKPRMASPNLSHAPFEALPFEHIRSTGILSWLQPEGQYLNVVFHIHDDTHTHTA